MGRCAVGCAGPPRNLDAWLASLLAVLGRKTVPCLRYPAIIPPPRRGSVQSSQSRDNQVSAQSGSFAGKPADREWHLIGPSCTDRRADGTDVSLQHVDTAQRIRCPEAPGLPKANADRRCHTPRQRHRVTNSVAHDAALRQRVSLNVWFAEEAIRAWKADLTRVCGRRKVVDADRRAR